MGLKQIEINGGRVTGDAPWRLEIPANRSGYTDAQIDDYHGLKRRNYIWQPGTHLSVRARLSPGANKLKGTAGFGFWNAPFHNPSRQASSQPPAIFGVCLPDVDRQKLHLFVILLIEITETHGPAHVWRSGEAAEY